MRPVFALDMSDPLALTWLRLGQVFGYGQNVQVSSPQSGIWSGYKFEKLPERAYQQTLLVCLKQKSLEQITHLTQIFTIYRGALLLLYSGHTVPSIETEITTFYWIISEL